MSRKISRFEFLEKHKSRDFDLSDGPYCPIRIARWLLLLNKKKTTAALSLISNRYLPQGLFPAGSHLSSPLLFGD
jgi:hypothetical protein